MAKGGAPRNAAPRILLLRPDHFLEQYIGAEMSVGGTLPTRGHALAGCLLQEGVCVLLALNVLGGGCHMVEDRDEIEIGLTRALIDVGEDVIALDPALGLLELHVLPVLLS